MPGEHFEGLLNYFEHSITNAISDGFNSRIQALLKTAPMTASINVSSYSKESGHQHVLQSAVENTRGMVMAELKQRMEPEGTPEENVLVRAAHRYLNNRTHAMDYQRALAEGLPIGSGVIESGHRHIFQRRLKVSGAAWLRSSAHAIAHARAARANQLWDSYWSQN